MRGAWKADYEYIFELHTEGHSLVGCDVITHVIVLGYSKEYLLRQIM